MEPMRGRAILVLLGLMAFGAYSVGRQSEPVSNAPVPAIITSLSALAQPVAFSGPMAHAPAPVASSRPISAPTPSAKLGLSEKSASPDTKRKVEAALTAAAIAVCMSRVRIVARRTHSLKTTSIKIKRNNMTSIPSGHHEQCPPRYDQYVMRLWRRVHELTRAQHGQLGERS
jgi:hypothetical protein